MYTVSSHQLSASQRAMERQIRREGRGGVSEGERERRRAIREGERERERIMLESMVG